MKKLLIIFMCSLLLVGCKNNSNNNLTQEKIISEIEYFGSQIAIMLNNLNNITLDNYELISEKVKMPQENDNSKSSEEKSNSGNTSQNNSKSSEQSSTNSKEEKSITVTDMQINSILKTNTEDIDWNSIKNQIELINTSWSIVMLDLSNNNVSNEDMTAFGNLINQTIISIENEDKMVALSNLSNLYSYIPEFLTAISAEQYMQNLEKTKYYIFSAYTSVSQDDWDLANINISNSEESYLKVLKDVEFSKNKEFKINKAYVLIKDVQNSLINRDKGLFFLKYKNLMESLNTL